MVRGAGNAGLMFFLMRMAFWLSLVLILLPSGSAQRGQPVGDVAASDAVSAASDTVHDLRGFCAREPNACSVGSRLAVAMGYRARAGAKMLYDFLTDTLGPRETGSLGTQATQIALGRSPPPESRDTLTRADLATPWHGPLLHKTSKPAI
jgi:hypothetical protein